MLTIAAFTGGKTVPSARFRVRQYIPGLLQEGIAVHESAARFGSYPPLRRLLRPCWAALCLGERLTAIAAARSAHVTLLQREMLSTLATVERFTKSPRVLDVDDAIWLTRKSQFAVSIARLCRMVICGNSYIADYFASHGCEVEVLPTPVDTDRLAPAKRTESDDARVICWAGMSSGHRYLQSIEDALKIVLRGDRRRRLRVIGDLRPRLSSIDPAQVDFVPWSEATEVESVRTANVGIMPLDNSSWSRGKCAYKLLTYMACGLPVVASPVGMNTEVLKGSHAGLFANTRDEWVGALSYLLDKGDEARRMGSCGRRTVVQRYSLKSCTPRLAGILRSVADSGLRQEVLECHS
ncbi:MAG: glycosyltransferase family 4 protein [Bryobacterales bacterium]|nr:glycosyltransferase family 4 protein [Bryobacterales bacterium]